MTPLTFLSTPGGGGGGGAVRGEEGRVANADRYELKRVKCMLH